MVCLPPLFVCLENSYSRCSHDLFNLLCSFVENGARLWNSNKNSERSVSEMLWISLKQVEWESSFLMIFLAPITLHHHKIRISDKRWWALLTPFVFYIYISFVPTAHPRQSIGWWWQEREKFIKNSLGSIEREEKKIWINNWWLEKLKALQSQVMDR